MNPSARFKLCLSLICTSLAFSKASVTNHHLTLKFPAIQCFRRWFCLECPKNLSLLLIIFYGITLSYEDFYYIPFWIKIWRFGRFQWQNDWLCMWNSENFKNLQEKVKEEVCVQQTHISCCGIQKNFCFLKFIIGHLSGLLKNIENCLTH